jgi:hypothetical protein
MNTTALLAGAAALAWSADALAVINLTAGSATYSFTQPTSATGSGGSANMAVGDGNASDHLFQDQWWWRVNGVSAREFAFFGGAEAGSGTANGSVTYTNVGGLGFDAVLNLALTDTGTAQASLTSTLVITNNSGAALDMSLFSYLDFDIGGTAGGDNAVWQDQANNIMRISEGANFGEYQGVGANAFQVTTFATLRGLLADADIDNMNNTGIPFGPGDFTGGFQWNSPVAGGGSLTLTTVRTINTAIPAPGALALLGLAGLVGGRRRRA